MTLRPIGETGKGEKEVNDAYGATIAKRELAERLRELGESGDTADLAGLLNRHGIQGDEREYLLALAARAEPKGWWEEFREIFENDFPGYEHDAARIRVYSPHELSRLVHTPAYTRAMLGRRMSSPAWRKRATEAVRNRQAILDRVNGTAPELLLLMTQAALEYHWGDRVDRLEQVEHLIDLNRKPNIQIRVQTFEDGPPPRISSPISIFDFPEGHPSPLVYVETGDTFAEVSGPDSVQTYIKSFEEACDAALEPRDTTVYLEKLASRLG